MVSNYAQSNIVGYYDKPDRNLGKGAPPCRLTSFTEKQTNKWKDALPFIKEMDNCFKKLNPSEYKKQLLLKTYLPQLTPSVPKKIPKISKDKDNNNVNKNKFLSSINNPINPKGIKNKKG